MVNKLWLLLHILLLHFLLLCLRCVPVIDALGLNTTVLKRDTFLKSFGAAPLSVALIPHVDSHHSPLRKYPEARVTTVAEYIAQNFRVRQQSAAFEVGHGTDGGDPSPYVVYMLVVVRCAMNWVSVFLDDVSCFRYQFNPGFYRENPAVMTGMTALLDALRAVPGVEVPREAGL